jgi:hypothetical protein
MIGTRRAKRFAPRVLKTKTTDSCQKNKKRRVKAKERIREGKEKEKEG